MEDQMVTTGDIIYVPNGGWAIALRGYKRHWFYVIARNPSEKKKEWLLHPVKYGTVAKTYVLTDKLGAKKMLLSALSELSRPRDRNRIKWVLKHMGYPSFINKFLDDKKSQFIHRDSICTLGM